MALKDLMGAAYIVGRESSRAREDSAVSSTRSKSIMGPYRVMPRNAYLFRKLKYCSKKGLNCLAVCHGLTIMLEILIIMRAPETPNETYKDTEATLSDIFMQHMSQKSSSNEVNICIYTYRERPMWFALIPRPGNVSTRKRKRDSD